MASRYDEAFLNSILANRGFWRSRESSPDAVIPSPPIHPSKWPSKTRAFYANRILDPEEIQYLEERGYQDQTLWRTLGALQNLPNMKETMTKKEQQKLDAQWRRQDEEEEEESQPGVEQALRPTKRRVLEDGSVLELTRSMTLPKTEDKEEQKQDSMDLS